MKPKNKILINVFALLIFLLITIYPVYANTKEDVIKARNMALHEFIVLKGKDTTFKKTEIQDFFEFDFLDIKGGNFGDKLSQQIGSRSGKTAFELYEMVGSIGLRKGGEETSSNIKIELDMPSYLPEFYKHPKKWFAGRTLKITSPNKFSSASITLNLEKTNNRINLPIKRRKDMNSASIDIPTDIPTGRHILSVILDGKQIDLPIEINAIPKPERKPTIITPPPTTSTITYRTTICDNCYWEMVFAGHPRDPRMLFHMDQALLSRSVNGGRTWSTEFIELIDYPFGYHYVGDPKIVVLDDLSFFFSGLFTGGTTIGGVLYYVDSTGKITTSIFQGTSDFDDNPSNSFVDHPILLVNLPSVYIWGNFAWFEDINAKSKGLYISRDNGKTFTKKEINIPANIITTSMTIGSDGTLYAAYIDSQDIYPGNAVKISRFNSFDPLLFDTLPTPAISIYSAVATAKISTGSSISLNVYLGPEIIADTSPHQGRLYIIWAQPESIIQDPSFEYGSYGYNYDIFVSHSDDKGVSWSLPVRVNDDTGKGDQFFPSGRVDDKGMLHIAFVDHRDNQDLPVFDVYYAYSSDGGNSFSQNLKITDAPFPITSGGRAIGDYLDMVMPYPNSVYVSFPCGDNGKGFPKSACMVEIKNPPSAVK